MADTQSKIEAAAEKAFAEAAEKKTAAAVAGKPAVASEKAEPTPKAAASVALKARRTAKKAPVRKSAKKADRKAASSKPAARAAKPAQTTTTITQLKDKIMATTKNTTADFTAKMQETAAEMQTRAKAAYDKGAEMTADVTAFQKGNFDALVESGKVLAAGMQDLGRNAVEDAKTAAETVTADVKAIAAVKSPTELFQLQGEIARRNLDTLVAATSKNAEVMMKLANDMFAPLSSRASVAMERFNKAA